MTDVTLQETREVTQSLPVELAPGWSGDWGMTSGLPQRTKLEAGRTTRAPCLPACPGDQQGKRASLEQNTTCSDSSPAHKMTEF